MLQTYDVYESTATTTVNEKSPSLLRVKSEFTNFEKSQSIFTQDSPYICSECGKLLAAIKNAL